jgi:nucleoside-diphosphate-sugar epimerase
MLGLSYAKSFELPVTLVRPFNTFGPRQSMRAVIPTIIVQALTSSQINLGKLTPVRDFNYVADTVAGFIAAAQPVENRGQVFNLATGKGYSIKEVAELIVELTRSKATIKSTAERLRPESSEVEMLIGNADKAEQLLNWKAKTDLAAGLGKTIDWIKSNLEHFPGAQSFIK